MIELLCWIGLALIHLIPAFGLVRPTLLTRLYGIEPGTDIFTLMQHRAALFGVVTLIALWAAVEPSVRALALTAVGFSMVSFLILWWRAGASPRLKTIAVTDLIGLPLWGMAALPVLQSGMAGS